MRYRNPFWMNFEMHMYINLSIELWNCSSEIYTTQVDAYEEHSLQSACDYIWVYQYIDHGLSMICVHFAIERMFVQLKEEIFCMFYERNQIPLYVYGQK